MIDEERFSDKDGQIVITVERHYGGVAVITDVQGNKSRMWLTPNMARNFGKALQQKADSSPQEERR